VALAGALAFSCWMFIAAGIGKRLTMTVRRLSRRTIPLISL
jgi:hypothetical protein